MKLIRIGRAEGCVFVGLEVGSYCFVPVECIILKAADGKITFDPVLYVVSSWHKRNSAFNTDTSGTRLFPQLDGYVDIQEGTMAAKYIEKLQRIYSGRESVKADGGRDRLIFAHQ